MHLIRWNSGQVQVVCSDNIYYADMVLVTCSLGVLKDRADKLFTPLLPEKKRRAIEVSAINFEKYSIKIDSTFKTKHISGSRLWNRGQNFSGVS